ncbi:hypothetical protein [Aliiglaciecola lipolytica]|uniref:Uncharacterized protein n=1 Tax=Aliiglaciecola lipolytica E3 TaxID=1127673 RepID=K6YHV6_9ALTE|nr:hypothetical protein [Aliiglaciecola lipolytica]GAC16203.1 hypothetical protein GLIP_3592 [Aliiglaciecola lipolytica E3]
MKWIFWTLLLLSFILINEITVQWLLAINIGGYEAHPGFERAIQNFTLDSFLFSSSFRLIPYSVLSAIALFSNLKNSTAGKIALSCSLAAISAFHFWGYWSMQHSLFTSEHTTSTAGLDILFIPIYAVWISTIAGGLAYGSTKIMKLS